MAAAKLIACRIAHAQQQPLAFQPLETAALAAQAEHALLWQGALRVNQLTKITPTFGPEHIKGEIRGQHRCGTHQQHGQHFPAPGASAPDLGIHHARRGRQGMNRQAQRLVSETGGPLWVCVRRGAGK